MQGLQSLNEFKNFVSKIGGLGRYEDTYIVHAAEGETVVPMEVLDRNPVLKKRLFKTMIEMGIEPGRYIVGNELNSKNPVTGQPEFFLKKIIKQIRKALPGDSEKYLGTIVGLATGNPYLGAIAGGVGSGMSGAIGGGLTGYRSPGIGGLSSNMFGGREIFGQTKTDPLAFSKLFAEGGGDEFKRFLTGGKDTSGLIGSEGKFLGMGASKQLSSTDAINSANKLVEQSGGKLGYDEAFKYVTQFSDKASKSGMSLTEYLMAIGIIGSALGTDKPEDQGEKYKYAMTGESYPGVINQSPVYAAKGGVMDLQDGGESKGPGTGTSDSIPAMLSDGEFVMTAEAVRGAGGGDRREGARKMYETMNKLEARA